MVKFYVLTADGNGDFVSDITTVSIQVNYPAATSVVAAGQTGYYIPGAEKFQLNATKNANGTWSANQADPNMLDGSDPNPEYYPSVPFPSGTQGADAKPPTWAVRVLKPGIGNDLVDINADGNPNPGTSNEADDIPLSRL